MSNHCQIREGTTKLILNIELKELIDFRQFLSVLLQNFSNWLLVLLSLFLFISLLYIYSKEEVFCKIWLPKTNKKLFSK